MPRSWQEIDAVWHACHSWQDLTRSMITAMDLLIIILALAALTALPWIAMTLVNDIRHDGYGRPGSGHTPPRSHHPDPFDPRSRFA